MHRDEAAARAREEADEQRMQEIDAARRLAILRGETPPPLEDKQETDAEQAGQRRRERHALEPARDGSARKRKRNGEDDTDFEMRVAREQAEMGGRASRELLREPPNSASIIDTKGHISLFNAEEARRGEKKEDAEREAAKKKPIAEDQYRVRLADAAGKGATVKGPWYATPDDDASAALVPSKDVFGNEDPWRKVREVARLDASDPLAMMKKGAAKVREIGKDRRRETEEREKELKALRKEQRRREKHKRRKEENIDGSRNERRVIEPTRSEHADHGRRIERHERSKQKDEDRRRYKRHHRDGENAR